MRICRRVERPGLDPRAGKWWDVFNLKPKFSFYLDGRKALGRAIEQANGKPFRIVGPGRTLTVLPPPYAEDIRNDKRLDFGKVVAQFVSHEIPGFEGFASGLNDLPVVLDMCKYKLTRELASVIEPLPAESEMAIEDILQIPHSDEWQKVPIKQRLNLLVARVSGRVFLGEELCRDPAWLNIAVSHIMTGFLAALSLRMFPAFMRPFVHWFLPPCRKLRSQVEQARSLIRPVIEKRKQEKATAIAKGETPTEYNDSIDWSDTYSNGRKFDRADLQLGLSIASVHNTTDLLSQVVYDLAGDPEMVQRLREEAKQVIGESGWSKTSLYNLKLLDSVIKESMRIKPILTVAMPREVTEEMTLPDGVILPEGTVIGVSAERHWDSDIYPEPHTFIGDRFLKMRQTSGKENVAQLVTTSINHLGFGHGNHACPGRFLAAAEIKVILTQLILGKDYVHYAEAKNSILGAPKDRHTQLRRILSRGFTNSAVLDQEGLIKSHVDQLFNILAEHEQSQGPRTPIDMNKLFDFVALDIITDLGFGDSFHCLHTRKYHPWAQFFLDALPAIALATALKQFQLIFSVLMAMAPKSVLQKHENMVRLTNDIVERRLDEADRPDLIQAMKKPTSGLEAKQPLSLQDIQANAQILTMAGYDTTATALAGTTYLLAANADVMARLTQEVRSSFKEEKEITISSTKSLGYLRAVIDESLRMYPPGASGMPRRIGEEGDVVLGHHIPAGYAMYHHAKNFSDPETFIPERWSNDKIDLSDKREAFQPFSFGPRDCIGRHLAYAELCIIIARLVWRFDLELDDVPGQNWLGRQKNYLLWDRGPLNIRLKQRA
ncbi:Cytochrome P450 monooygenase 1 [Colletotrichum sp. SAR 10_77]|nr:Cytochrome P450 monooygenase 1 [Colletotrichum sp. SAR 10_77]